VLVVEDDPVMAGMIRNFLTKSEYRIAGMVTTGEEAVKMAGSSKPDLMLMDVHLDGEMDGIEAAHLIWSQFHIPVVYLTSSADDETIYRAASSEAYGYLQKPVREKVLSSTIQLALYKYEADCRLKEKEKWLETTLQCITDAVIAADSVGSVKLINPAAEALTGWTQSKAVGLDILDVYQVLEPGTRMPAECAVVKVVRDGAAHAAGLARILVAKDGTETPVVETVAPIVNDEGNILGVVLVFRVS
jgi:PAS domain S-box-containing protein